MADIGSGSGSSYPGALDTQSTEEVNTPSVSKTKARAAVPNDLAACIIAIETELGTDPAGTLTDVKTFLQTEHSTTGTHTTNAIAEKTSGSGVTVDGCLIKDGAAAATTDGTNKIKFKVININAWNMDSTASVSVAHGLTFGNLRGVSAMIIDDSGSIFYDFYCYNVAGTGTIGITIDSTNVNLYRLSSGFFDSSSFDDGVMNRGYIFIVYVA